MINQVAKRAVRIACGLLLSAALWEGGSPALGAVITVNTTSDVVSDDGQCSLREAVIAANSDTASGASGGECAAGSGSDTISLPAGTYALTKTGSGENAAATGDLDVSQTVTINGAGEGSTIIDGNGTDRIFDVTNSSATLELTDMTLQNGDTGGGGGAISTSSSTVILSDCTITGNDAGSGGALNNSSGSWTLTNITLSGNSADAGLSGGAINSSSGSWTFDNCTISGNTINNGPGGAINTSSGTWNFTDSTFSGNMAPDGTGGAINSSNGTWTFTDSTFSGNISNSDGGAIRTSGGTWTFTDTTFSGNSVTTTTASGGGIHTSGGSWTFDGCTFSGNAAGTDMSSADGGGVNSTGSGGTFTFANTTFSGNSAGYRGGGMAVPEGDASFNNCTLSGNSAYNGGGLYQGESGTIDIENTIVANSPSGGDCDGTIGSSGYNLDSDGTCGLSSTGDLSSMDPKLGALADNGGSTLTHALLTGSPAIDAGNDATCEATDQRGVSRPAGDSCDMGSYELEGGGVPGDGNGDGDTNAADLSFCAALLGSINAACDLDSDGTVEVEDIVDLVKLIFGVP